MKLIEVDGREQIIFTAQQPLPPELDVWTPRILLMRMPLKKAGDVISAAISWRLSPLDPGFLKEREQTLNPKTLRPRKNSQTRSAFDPEGLDFLAAFVCDAELLKRDEENMQRGIKLILRMSRMNRELARDAGNQEEAAYSPFYTALLLHEEAMRERFKMDRESPEDNARALRAVQKAAGFTRHKRNTEYATSFSPCSYVRMTHLVEDIWSVQV